MFRNPIVLTIALVTFADVNLAGEFGRRSVSRYMDWTPSGCYKPYQPSFFVVDVDTYNMAVAEYNNYLSEIEMYFSCIRDEAQTDAGLVTQAISNGLEEAHTEAMSDLQNARNQLESAKLLLY